LAFAPREESILIRTRWVIPLVFGVLLAGVSCSKSDRRNPNPLTPSPLPADLGLVTVETGFSAPVFMTSPPGDDRLFVVEQTGTIRIIKNGSTLATPFLDVSGLIAAGYEQGLLSMAFRPDYASSGRFYLFYVDGGGDIRIARYHVSADPDVADPTADEIVLTIEHSQYGNHNGGLLLFGPDGKLYVGVGDGGAGGDPYDTGQNPNDMLGCLLRIDVSGASGWSVPAGNPIAGNPVWCWGLRNPWRFSFDRGTGDLYVADVGQDLWEEVNVAPAAGGRGAGANFGWDIMEGAHCYNSATCDPQGKVLPVVEHAHSASVSAIIGGYVYRGDAIPGLRGHYLYADNAGTWLRSFRYANGQATEQKLWGLTLPAAPLSFAEDRRGEIYVLTGDGRVSRIVP